MQPAIAQGHSTDSVKQFRELALRFVALVGEEGTKATAFHSESLPHFSALNPDEQRAAIAELAGMLEIYDEIKAEGKKLHDTPQLLWRSLRKLGYVWESDFFDKIEDGDVVQLMTTVGFRFCFWNLRLVEMVSFTIEQLFCTSWWLLGRREPDVSPLITESVMDVLTERRPGTIAVNHIPEHIATERETQELLSFRIRLKYLSPVRREGKIVGLLCTNGADFVGSGRV